MDTSSNQKISEGDLPVNVDDSMQEMTASYSEISIDSDSDRDSDLFIFQRFSKLTNTGQSRPTSLEIKAQKAEAVSSLEYLQGQGTVEREGDMVMFFSEDLETKIKLSSPTISTSGGESSSLFRQIVEPNLPPLDMNVLNALEEEARRLATALDSLTENLAGYLRSVSALTVDCLETYRDAVCNTCDAIDANIKAMYQLMAKTEELGKSMSPLYALSDQIKEMKRLLDLYDNAMGH